MVSLVRINSYLKQKLVVSCTISICTSLDVFVKTYQKINVEVEDYFLSPLTSLCMNSMLLVS